MNKLYNNNVKFCIISTSKGLMSNIEALKIKQGGEVLCEINYSK